MIGRKFRVLSLGLALGVVTFSSCGGGGGNGGNVATIEITADANPLFPRQSKLLTAVARDSAGQVVDNVTIEWESSNERFASIPPTGSTAALQALYPGAVTVTARIGAVAEDFLQQINAPDNQGTILPLTNNALDDNWGGNNNWAMTSRDQVLWISTDTVTTDVILGDNDGNDSPLRSALAVDVDFLAFGSMDLDSEGVFASWREGLADTYVSNDGAAPQNLGPQVQEENSVSDGFLFFREGLPANDMWAFTFGAGLDEVFTTGDSLGPVFTSAGQAVWQQGQGGTSDLAFFDGTDVVTVTTGLPNGTTEYGFRLGMSVYAKNNDIFLFDGETGQTANITNQPLDLNAFPKTDGNSVVFTRQFNGTDYQVVLYDIASGNSEVISTTNTPKVGSTLWIDSKQVVWLEGTALYFHDGSGTAAGTSAVASPVLVEVLFKPYVADGTVAWIGDDGDDEVFVMK